MAQNSEDAPTPANRPKINTNAASASTKEQVDKDIQLVRMFCMNLRFPNILEDGFREFINNISNYTLPSKNKFFEELFPEEFNRARSDLMETLESVHHMAISIETWKWGVTEISNMLTATVHFVHQSKLVSQTLLTIEVKLQSEDVIVSAIQDEFIKWKILRKVVVVVKSGNLKKEHPQLLQKIVSVLNLPIIYCMTDHLKRIFKKSTTHLNFKELETRCQNDLLFKKKKDEPFSWHDQYILLKYIRENNAGDFTADERKAFGECFQMLKPFEDLNNRLSSEQYLSISYVIPLFIGLNLRIKECAPSSSQAKELQKQFEQSVWPDAAWWKFRVKATFMDPRFKTTVLNHNPDFAFTQTSKEAGAVVRDVKQNVEKELNKCIDSRNQHNPVSSTSNNQSEENKNLLDYLTRIDENIAHTSSSLAKSVSHYVQVPDLHPDEDPFQFWEDFHRIFKCSPFYIMSHKYLCIPANAIPIESISGELPWNKFVRNNIDFKERRNSLQYENINEILFLNSYYSRTSEINI